MSTNIPFDIFDRDSCTLSGPFNLSVVEVINISESKYSFLEKFRIKEAKVSNRNKTVINDVQQEDDSLPWQEKRNQRPSYKLVLEDQNGTKIYAVTMDSMDISVLPPTSVTNNVISPGSKITISNVRFQRGVILLKRSSIDDIQTMIVSVSTLRELEKKLQQRLEKELDKPTHT